MSEAPIDISNAGERLRDLRLKIIGEFSLNEDHTALSIREMMTINSICNTCHLMSENQLVDSFIFMEQMFEQVRGRVGV